MIFYRTVDENLSPQELHRSTHALLANVMKRHYGIESFRLEYGEHGKPYFAEYPDIHFNLSHCRGLIVCGISDSPVGVDAELIRSYNGKAANRIFSESELTTLSESKTPDEYFFRIWTLKEALGKNIGTGLSSKFNKVSFSLCGEDVRCDCFGEKYFTQKIIEKKWVVSICTDNPCFINRNAFLS